MHPTPEPTTLTPAHVQWRDDGTAFSPQFGDIFHASAGAVAQSHYVFVAGNALPERWQAGENLVIAELGFGSGLNFLCTLQAFLQSAPAHTTLHYLAVEQQPWTLEDSQRLLQGLPPELVDEWLAVLPWLCVGSNRVELLGGRVQLTLVIGTVEAVLPQVMAAVDVWYLDGFNPAKNAAMWSPAVARELGRLSRPGATLATWCCAGDVRRALQAVGFRLSKAAGFASKREMLRGRFAGEWVARPVVEGPICIAGAGLAGAWLARTLAERGYGVEIHDTAVGPGGGASAMPMMMVRPFAKHRDTPMARWLWQASHHAARRYAALQIPSWRPEAVYRQHGDEEPRWLEPAGWLSGMPSCSALLDHPKIRCHWSSRLAWNHHEVGARVWCTAQAPAGMPLHTALRAIRGQQSLWPEQAEMLGDCSPRVGDVVACRCADDLLFGASYVYDDTAVDIRPDEALVYGQKLPRPPRVADVASMQHFAATRSQSRDRLPLCGPLAVGDLNCLRGREAGRCAVADLPTIANQWVNLAHGARGATSAPLAAALLADQICGTPSPVLRAEADALDPRRFLLRAWRRGELKL